MIDWNAIQYALYALTLAVPGIFAAYVLSANPSSVPAAIVLAGSLVATSIFTRPR